MKPCSSLCMGDCKHLSTPPSLLMDDSSIPAKQTNTFLINRRRVSSCTVISIIFVLFLFSSANALSQLDPINGIRLGWNKRGGGGSVNFSPGWGKRSNIPDLLHPDENFQENDLESSGQWEKRSGGSVNFSPGWGKRGGGGSVNFSPGWGKRSSMSYFPSSSKRAVNFSPSWGKRAVNFSPSWGKRNVVESRFSDLMGKRSGGSVNFSPGWGKRSGGSVNFSPSWGKRNAAWHQAPQIFRENLLQGNQGKYDNHLFKILLENFYGKNILDRIGAIKNNNNENETEPDVQSAATQKRADDWGDIYDKVEQEHLNKNMLGAHQGWKRTAEGDDTSLSKKEKP